MSDQENTNTAAENPEGSKDPTVTAEAAESPAAPGCPLPEPGVVRLNRRNFVGKTMVGAGVVVGAELGYAGFKLLATKPVGERKPVQMSLAQLPEGSRATVLYGGIKVEVRHTAEGIKALSMVCTHLGCLVIWEGEKEIYHCPCHDAYYDADGGIISGPVSQPLEEIPVTVSGNTVIIGG